MSDMLILAALGAGLGFSVWLLTRALVPRAVPLDRAMARLSRAAPSYRELTEHAGGVVRSGPLTALGHRSTDLVLALGWTEAADLDRRLAAADKTRDDLASEQAVAAIAGAALPLVIWAMFLAAGESFPFLAVLPASVLLGAAGAGLPWLLLNSVVEERALQFRTALSAYLDLVSVMLAAGTGLETSFHTAAEAGDSWAFEQIRRALRSARRRGQTPWEGFSELAERLDIEELRELAASARLAGDHGARVRQTIVTKADSMRERQIAQAEMAAESATERMSIPVAILVFALILFIGFGVVARLSTPFPF
jgi:Flp pilus assembly protein TadB